MFKSDRETVRRLCLSIIALLQAAILIFGFTLAGPTSSAQAADTNDTSANINPKAKGSITVHKYAQPNVNTDLSNDGTRLDDATLSGLAALAGVTFTIKQIPGVDLTTDEGWNTVGSQYKGADAVANAQQATRDVAGASVVTGSDGSAAFKGLELGAYLVSETDQPGNVTPAAPFIVTVPLPGPKSDGTWLYDVHAYPKNIVSDIPKTVEQGTTNGDPVSWSIRGSIPGGKATDLYRIVDNLDSRLDFNGADVSLVNHSGTPLAGFALGSDDYTVTPSQATANGPSVTVEFTEAGRAKLFTAVAANAGAHVKIVVHTTVNGLGADGVIPNTAVFFPNKSSVEKGGIPTPPVEAKFGNVTIKKVEKDSTKVLSGAQFQLFHSKSDAQTKTNPIAVEGTETWTTDKHGLLTISGVAYGSYWLRETKAPEGYQAFKDPITARVGSLDNNVDYTVEDEPVPTPPVPGLAQTGAGIGGLLVIAAGAWVIGTLLMARKRVNRRTATPSESTAVRGDAR